MQDYPYTIAFFENRLKKAKEKLQHAQSCHRDEEAIRITSKIIHYQRALEALSAPETMRKQSALKCQEISRIRQNAYVLCSFGESGLFYRVPWVVWTDMKNLFGRKYVTAEDLKEYRIKIGGPGVLMFLDGLKWEDSP